MRRELIVSENLRSVGYNHSTETLEIEFNESSIYEYYDVPEHIFIALMNASSHGKYFFKNIRFNYKTREK